MRCIRAVVASLALLCGAPIAAHAAQLTIGNAWFRALPGGLPAGGYFVLRNVGGHEAVLTGARSPACGMLMLHKSTQESGMDRMEMVDSVAVPAKGDVRFAPGGLHLMCTEPGPEMTPGGRIAVTFEFADGTKLSASFRVKNARGQ